MSHYCERARESLYPYLDREIGWTFRLRIWWHLRRCPPCDEQFRFEQKLLQKVHDDCMEDVPPELYDRLWSFLREQGPTEPGAGHPVEGV